MATTRFFLDTVAIHADGTAPVKLILSNGKQVAKITTGIYVPEHSWNTKTSRVVNYPQSKTFNLLLDKYMCRAQMLMIDAQMEEGKNFSIKKVRAKYEGMDTSKDNRPTIRDFFLAQQEDKSLSKGTQHTYVLAQRKYDAYCDKTQEPTWEEVTPEWLTAFDDFLAETAPSANARSINMRCLRRIFSIAKKEKHITDNYPFENFHIKQQRTRKRSVSARLLYQLFNAPCKPYQQKYVDVFKMLFFMRGINAKDFVLLRKDDYFDGRIYYNRCKTSKDYSIKVEPELEELIDKYSTGDSEYLFPILDRWKYENGYEGYFQDVHQCMQSLTDDKGKVIAPKITSYWIRHSWATIASELDIPKETISEGLGHEIGCATTSIYIDFDQKKVDRANRKIMDYVLYEKGIQSLD